MNYNANGDSDLEYAVLFKSRYFGRSSVSSKIAFRFSNFLTWSLQTGEEDITRSFLMLNSDINT
jgi:hypothetical protein